jgi:hypothetical protein
MLISSASCWSEPKPCRGPITQPRSAEHGLRGEYQLPGMVGMLLSERSWLLLFLRVDRQPGYVLTQTLAQVQHGRV